MSIYSFFSLWFNILYDKIFPVDLDDFVEVNGLMVKKSELVKLDYSHVYRFSVNGDTQYANLILSGSPRKTGVLQNSIKRSKSFSYTVSK